MSATIKDPGTWRTSHWDGILVLLRWGWHLVKGVPLEAEVFARRMECLEQKCLGCAEGLRRQSGRPVRASSGADDALPEDGGGLG